MTTLQNTMVALHTSIPAPYFAGTSARKHSKKDGMKRGRTRPFSNIGGTGIQVSEPMIMKLAQRVSISIRIAWVLSVTVMDISGRLPSPIPRTREKLTCFSPPSPPFWGMSDSNIAVFAGVPDLVVPSMSPPACLHPLEHALSNTVFLFKLVKSPTTAPRAARLSTCLLP